MTGRRPGPAGRLSRAIRAARTLPLVTVVLALSVLLALGFAIRLTVGPDPAARDPPLADWMPVGYVAHSWDVPRDVLARALDLPPGSAPRRSLRSLARDRGEPTEVLIARIEAAIADYRRAGP